jgi:hypothetical protein
LDDGTFSKKVEVDSTTADFKFVVDGEWKINNEYDTVTDDQVVLI